MSYYTLDGQETLSNLDSQPYLAFVDLIIGGYQFPNIPPKYIQSLTIQDLGTEGTTVTLTILDELGDEIEEMLYRSINEKKYLRFGHINGRQSKLIEFNLFTYTLSMSSTGSLLVIVGQGVLTTDNLSDATYNAGSTPSDAVKTICDKLGYVYDSTTIHDTRSIILGDGSVKEFNLVQDNPIDYIHKEISPYAIRLSDGLGGYQFYIDESTTPPTAYFHPIEISEEAVRTYIYMRGINTNVISFEVSSDFIIAGEGQVGITSVLEANVLDPVTKVESHVSTDINNVGTNVNGGYSHIDSKQYVETVNTAGMNHGETVSTLNYRMTLSQGTLDASLTIVGDPTVKINNEIRMIVLNKRNTMHHTSGRYKVLGVSHTISSGIMTTVLSISKTGDVDGVELKSYKSLYK